MTHTLANRRIFVIMAGGSGERFWPLSRQGAPKQLLNLAHPRKSLLREAVDRAAALTPREHILIVTGKRLQPAIRRAGLGLPPGNVLAEPCKRNTAGCLAYAAAYAMRRLGGDGSDVTMAVITADHRIGAPQAFRAAVRAALDAAERHDALVTVGIRPTRPETGYGYVEVPPRARPVPGSPADLPVLPVLSFREKPDRAAAARYVASGRFYWNSGMFFWRLSTFLRELDRAAPAFGHAVRSMARDMAQRDRAAVEAVFEALPDISIDYALMEKARRVLMARGDFPWDDIGAWDSLARGLPADEAGNVAVGNPLVLDSRGCVVYNAAGARRMAVAVLGCRDLVVVARQDSVLVLPRARSQEVKRVVAELRRRGASQV